MKRILLSEAQSRDYLSRLFQHMGSSAAQSEIVADHLTLAEMRGLASHGLSRIPFYTRKLRAGGYNAHPNFTVMRETSSTVLLDADNAIGLVSSTFAMQLCIEKARKTGCASVSVTHANHIGFLAYYTMMAARENMIGLAICNAGACTAVWGTNQRVLGTDPLSVALPALNHPPVVFDAATSVVAQGKIAVAAMEGNPIPDNWAFGPNGRPTTNANEALEGTMRPFGDYKGSGLAVIIALITAGLGGVAFDMEEENLRRAREDALGSDLSDFFAVVDISAFADVPAFRSRVDSFIDLVKAFRPAPGFDEILMPGEIEWRKCEKARAGGFEIGENLYRVLQETNRDLGFKYDISAWEH